MNITGFENYLTCEMADLEKAAEAAKEKGLIRMYNHCRGASDALEIARAVLRVRIIKGKVGMNDAIIAELAQKYMNRPKKILDKNEKTLA